MGNQSYLCSHINHKMVSLLILLSCVLVSVSAVELEDIADVTHGRSREPKLFFVSSSSTTSSLSTSTVCFKATATGAVTCGKRKKRSMVVNGISEADGEIQPQRSFDAEESYLLNQKISKLESGAEDPTTSDRDGRFLLYWLTTTSTSTTTIYTGTSTIASLDCTPSGYTVKEC